MLRDSWKELLGDVPYDAVCPLADDIEDLVVGTDDEARQTFVHAGQEAGAGGDDGSRKKDKECWTLFLE